MKLYYRGLRSIIYANQLLRKFKNDTKNPRKIQEETLFRILKKNAGTEYSLKKGLGKVSTIDEFRKRHPLSGYKQFEEYIERTARGENNVIIPKRPQQITLTSGTTGKPKMILDSTERRLQFTRVFVLMEGVLTEAGMHSMYLTQKECKLYTHPKVSQSEAGIDMSIGSRRTRKDIPPTWVTPPAAYAISSDKESMYVHAVFSLKDEYLSAIKGIFCTNLCNFFREIEDSWRDIVHDISTGTIKVDLNVPSDVRSELIGALKPDPIRAEQLKREFERGFDGIAKRVWPYLRYMYGIVPASFQIYADWLENKYTKG